MTTVPGHNQILQQSGIAQELNNQAHLPKPGPDQAAAHQQAQEVVQNSTIQDTNASDQLKRRKKKEEERRARKLKKLKKRNREKELALDPDATGRLLDVKA
ncbi:MAG: hypothetical protein HUN05_20865 [Desulfobacter sp.]|nr:MAG: hypothetical protein HUN05_20865 [Desulfobacter sp.]